MRSGNGALPRGVTLGVLTAVLTVTGHGAGGGALPDPALLAVLVPPLCVLLAAVARRATAFLPLVALLGAGQVLLHLLISALEPSVHGTHLGHTADATGAGPLPMLLAHTVVTLLVAGAHRHADAAVAALGRLRRRVLPADPWTPRPARTAVPATGYAPPAGPRPGVLTGAGTHRGPPVPC